MEDLWKMNRDNMDAVNPKTIMDAIYKFEDDEKLLEFCFRDTDIPMWMLIRARLIRETVYRVIGIDYELIGNRGINHKERSYVDKYIRKNPFLSCNKDIIFAFLPYGKMSLHQNGMVYDDLVMPFMRLVSKKMTVIMDGVGADEQEKKCGYPNWKYDAIFRDVIRKENKNAVCSEDRKNIEKLLSYISENYPMDIERGTKEKMKIKLYRVSRCHKKLINLYELYLKIVRPKLVFVNEGSYLSVHTSAMNIACKNCHITTAEFQHAWVGKNHEIYNYGDSIVRSQACRKVLPDYLLTMGDYWNKQIKIPQKVYTVGYTKKTNRSITPENENVLFAASCEYGQYEEILNNILPRMDKRTKIYFRLHPLELTTPVMDQFKKYMKYSNFIMANEYDLQFYLQRCKYVIVDGSTVCYEALHMGRIVFGLNNVNNQYYGIDEIPYVKHFKTAEEFMELWDKRDHYKSIEHHEFYETNWKKNYIKFLRMQGIRIKEKREKT